MRINIALLNGRFHRRLHVLVLFLFLGSINSLERREAKKNTKGRISTICTISIIHLNVGLFGSGRSSLRILIGVANNEKKTIKTSTLPITHQPCFQVSNNLSIIFASILAAFTLSFGLGSRDIIKRLLFGYYSRKNLQVGSKIKTENFEGVIESIDNISVVLQTERKKIIIPIKEIVDNRVEVLS